MERPQPSVDPIEEDGEGDEEHDQRALEKEIESPFLECIQLTLTVRPALGPRSAFVLPVSGYESSHQHREEC